MSTVTTWATLKAELLRRSKRGSIDDDDLAEYASIGQDYLNRTLRVREMETSGTVTCSTSLRTASLPDGFLDAVSLVHTDIMGEPMQQVTPTEIDTNTQNNNSSRPYFYAISDVLEFERVPDQAYSLKMRFYHSLDLETPDSIATAVCASYPECYIYAGMVELWADLRNDKEQARFVALRDEAIKAANRQAYRGRNRNRLRADSALTANGGSFNYYRGY